jgi:hypothetical protein
MSFPSDVGAVDLMIGFPFKDKRAIYEYLRKGIKDAQSKDEYDFPVEYMFKDVPDEANEDDDPIETRTARGAFAQMVAGHPSSESRLPSTSPSTASRPAPSLPTLADG